METDIRDECPTIPEGEGHLGTEKLIRDGRPKWEMVGQSRKWEMVGVEREWSGGRMNGGHFASGSMLRVHKVPGGRVNCGDRMSGSEGVGAHGLSKA